ncbi:hypothetical protein CYMTET_41728 [Cymbomonas tetramitiformis]|uniref:Uncharacterized protein n=1 Tax=Cymbomonas tetramitiformis TaxID=36881 RepID=A0AAE0C5G9_9CHLO|nr:hypothetical protein CYMTET_41728 [Cymbomonas tetramitiformis]
MHAPEDVNLIALDDPEFTDTFLAPLVEIPDSTGDGYVHYVTPFYAANLDELSELLRCMRDVLGMKEYPDTRRHVLRELLLLARRSLAVTGEILTTPIGVWYDHQKELRLTFLHTGMPNELRSSLPVCTFISPRKDARGIRDQLMPFLEENMVHIFPAEFETRAKAKETAMAAIEIVKEDLQKVSSENLANPIESYMDCLDRGRASLLKLYEEPLELRPAANPLRGRSASVESVLHLA